MRSSTASAPMPPCEVVARSGRWSSRQTRSSSMSCFGFRSRERVVHRLQEVDLELRCARGSPRCPSRSALREPVQSAFWPPSPSSSRARPRAPRTRFAISRSRSLLLVAHLGLDLGLELGQVGVQLLDVDPRDQVRGEVDDLLEALRRDVEQVAEPARDTLEVPDVGDRGGELDVAHALAAHLRARDLDATALADDALEPDALVLAAVALPVLGRPEDLLAEQAVLLGLERAVVDRLGLLDLAVRPRADLVRGGEARWRARAESLTSSTSCLLSWFSARCCLRACGRASGAGRLRHRRVAPAPRLPRRCPARAGERSMPRDSVVRNASSSSSRISISSPSSSMTLTLRQSACISLMSTLKLSGIPGSGMFSPLTMAS